MGFEIVVTHPWNLSVSSSHSPYVEIYHPYRLYGSPSTQKAPTNQRIQQTFHKHLIQYPRQPPASTTALVRPRLHGRLLHSALRDMQCCRHGIQKLRVLRLPRACITMSRSFHFNVDLLEDLKSRGLLADITRCGATCSMSACTWAQAYQT